MHLKIMPTGIIPHDHPSDVLSLTTMQRLVEHLRNTFDLVIFDAPLVLAVPDVESLPPVMGDVLLAHAPGKSVKADILEATRVLQRAGDIILELFVTTSSATAKVLF